MLLWALKYKGEMQNSSCAKKVSETNYFYTGNLTELGFYLPLDTI